MKFKCHRVYESDSFGIDRFVGVSMRWSSTKNKDVIYIDNKITKEELNFVKPHRLKYLLLRARELRIIFCKSKEYIKQQG